MASTFTDRHALGLATLETVGGARSAEVLRSIESISPKAADYIVESVFGEIYQGDDLSLRDRELVSITALAALGGCEAQLRVHVAAAHNVGMSHEEIVEALVQMIPYVGVPRSLNALFITQEVLGPTGTSSGTG